MKISRKEVSSNSNAYEGYGEPILEDDILLQEKHSREFGDHRLDQNNWIAEFEEEIHIASERFKKECPYLNRDKIKKYFPHKGSYEVDSFDKQYRLIFTKWRKGQREWTAENPPFVFFYFVDKTKTKYEDSLSFEDALNHVQQDISRGIYDTPHPESYLNMRAASLYDDCSYLGGRASAAWKMRYEKNMDELVVHAFYSLPSLAQSRKPGIKLIIQHYEKRRKQMFDRKHSERTDAARFWNRLINWRKGNSKSVFPERLFVSGLVHFLLPIAWHLRDKYLLTFPGQKKRIERGVNESPWRKKIASLDRRLIRIEDKDGIENLIVHGPKYFIEQRVLPDFFNLPYRTIKDRIISEKKI